MRVSEAPVVDVRGPLTRTMRRLLNLLTSLSDAQWAAPTAAPQWPVKDIALHLLDVDLSWLAGERDHDQASYRVTQRWPNPSSGSAASSSNPEAGTVPPGLTPTHRLAQPPRPRRTTARDHRQGKGFLMRH